MGGIGVAAHAERDARADDDGGGATGEGMALAGRTAGQRQGCDQDKKL